MLRYTRISIESFVIKLITNICRCEIVRRINGYSALLIPAASCNFCPRLSRKRRTSGMPSVSADRATFTLTLAWHSRRRFYPMHSSLLIGRHLNAKLFSLPFFWNLGNLVQAYTNSLRTDLYNPIGNTALHSLTICDEGVRAICALLVRVASFTRVEPASPIELITPRVEAPLT